jgi:hypothetical protein
MPVLYSSKITFRVNARLEDRSMLLSGPTEVMNATKVKTSMKLEKTLHGLPDGSRGDSASA